MIRSILAVLAGIGTLTVTSFAIEAAANPLLMWLFPSALPNPAALNHNLWSVLFTSVYGVMCVAGGGYVTAWLAPSSPVRLALIMGMIQAAMVIPAMFAYPDQAPLYRWLIGMALIPPAAWYGGKLRAGTEMHGRPV